MITERHETDFGTELVIRPDEARRPWSAYRVSCSDFDIDGDIGRIEPTVRISLLTATNPTLEIVEQLAREYLFVAGAAAALQAEKRAAYHARFDSVEK